MVRHYVLSHAPNRHVSDTLPAIGERCWRIRAVRGHGREAPKGHAEQREFREWTMRSVRSRSRLGFVVGQSLGRA